MNILQEKREKKKRLLPKAAFLKIRKSAQTLAVMCGVVMAGVIMMLASLGVFGAAGAIFAK